MIRKRRHAKIRTQIGWARRRWGESQYLGGARASKKTAGSCVAVVWSQYVQPQYVKDWGMGVSICLSASPGTAQQKVGAATNIDPSEKKDCAEKANTRSRQQKERSLLCGQIACEPLSGRGEPPSSPLPRSATPPSTSHRRF